MRISIATLVLTACVLLAAPGGAVAATLTNAAGVLTYTAGAGVTNTVSVTPVGAAVRLADSGETISASGCTVVTAGSVFDCAGVTSIAVDLGDGNDSYATGAASSVPVTVHGGDGDDFLETSDGDDTLDAGGGTDVVLGHNGDDTLLGGSGDDELTAGDGNDALDGGPGDDELDGSAGADDVRGGSGIDVAFESAGANPPPAVAVTLDDLANDGGLGEGDDVHADVEDLDASSLDGASRLGDGPVTLVGDAASNSLTVSGGRGNLDGGAGSDILSGGPLDDTISSVDGYADRVTCSDGTDTVMADTLDAVSDSCENVQRTAVALPGPDALPTVTWAAPADRQRIAGSATTTLTATATDDLAVAKVQFLAGTRLVCEDATAPYTCAYRPRGDELGLRTLVAIAIDGAQHAATALRTVTVGRFTPTVALSVSPSRDRTAPLRFRASGHVTLPTGMSRSLGCEAGEVTVKVTAGTRTVATRHVHLSSTCTFASHITFHDRARVGAARSLRFTARLGETAALTAASAKSRTVRIR